MNSDEGTRRFFAALGFLTVLFAQPSWADTTYFPPTVFDTGGPAFQDEVDADGLNSSERRIARYSKFLSGLNEPSLLDVPSSSNVYRFTWLRSFDPPMIFRLVVLPGGNSTLVFKKSNGAGDHEPGKIVLETSIPVSREEAKRVTGGLGDMGFWTMQPHFQQLGLDGAEWMLEAAENGKYHVVVRQSPADSKFAAWCLELMKLSKQDLGKIY